MTSQNNTKIIDLTCEKSYYLPNTNIRVDEHNPVELEKLWSKIDGLNSFI